MDKKELVETLKGREARSRVSGQKSKSPIRKEGEYGMGGSWTGVRNSSISNFGGLGNGDERLNALEEISKQLKSHNMELKSRDPPTRDAMAPRAHRSLMVDPKSGGLLGTGDRLASRVKKPNDGAEDEPYGRSLANKNSKRPQGLGLANKTPFGDLDAPDVAEPRVARPISRLPGKQSTLKDPADPFSSEGRENSGVFKAKQRIAAPSNSKRPETPFDDEDNEPETEAGGLKASKQAGLAGRSSNPFEESAKTLAPLEVGEQLPGDSTGFVERRSLIKRTDLGATQGEGSPKSDSPATPFEVEDERQLGGSLIARAPRTADLAAPRTDRQRGPPEPASAGRSLFRGARHTDEPAEEKGRPTLSRIGGRRSLLIEDVRSASPFDEPEPKPVTSPQGPKRTLLRKPEDTEEDIELQRRNTRKDGPRPLLKDDRKAPPRPALELHLKDITDSKDAQQKGRESLSLRDLEPEQEIRELARNPFQDSKPELPALHSPDEIPSGRHRSILKPNRSLIPDPKDEKLSHKNSKAEEKPEFESPESNHKVPSLPDLPEKSAKSSAFAQGIAARAAKSSALHREAETVDPPDQKSKSSLKLSDPFTDNLNTESKASLLLEDGSPLKASESPPLENFEQIENSSKPFGNPSLIRALPNTEEIPIGNSEEQNLEELGKNFLPVSKLAGKRPARFDSFAVKEDAPLNPEDPNILDSPDNLESQIKVSGKLPLKRPLRPEVRTTKKSNFHISGETQVADDKNSEENQPPIEPETPKLPEITDQLAESIPKPQVLEQVDEKSFKITKSLPDEKPIGGGGGYNLDNLEELEKQFKPSGKAPIKRPIRANQPALANELPAGDERPIGARNTKPAEDERPIGKAKPADDERPIGGAKPAEDERPIGRAKPAEDERPLGGSKPTDDEKPLGKSKQIADDERPIGKAKPAEDERPIGKAKSTEDERPLGGSKPAEDEKPLGGSKPTEDERPLGGAKSAAEEKPLGGGGGYNLDNLEELEKMYKPSGKTLASRVKKPNLTEAEDKKEEKKPSADNEKPIKPATIDERPLGVKKSAEDERPLGAKPTPSEDRPLGTASAADEKPIGGGGGYNLDNLEELEKQFKPSGKAPIKRPLKTETSAGDERPLAKTKPAEDERPLTKTKPAEDERPLAKAKPAEDERPLGGTKPADDERPLGKAKPAEDERPLGGAKNAAEDKPIGGGGGGYNLDNLEELEKQFKPSGKAPIKRPLRADPPAAGDERPLGAAKPAEDERPLGGAKSATDEKPIGGGGGGYNLDNLEELEKQFKPSGKAPIKRPIRTGATEKNDEKPIGGAKPAEDERPVGGAKSAEDERSIGGAKPPGDERPIGGASAGDERPLGAAKSPDDEKPLGGGSGGYNLDNLEELEKQFKPSGKAPIKRPPRADLPAAGDEKPLGATKAPAEDKPIGGGGGGYNLDNLEELEKQFKPSGKAPIKRPPRADPPAAGDEKPLGATKAPAEDKPIGGGGGGYNLDNLEELEKQFKPSGKAPIKRPPRADPPEASDDRPLGAAKASGEDRPLGAAKAPGEDKPLGGGGGGYNLDNLEELEKQFKPSGKAPIKRPPRADPPAASDEKPLGGGKAPSEDKPLGGGGGGYNLDNLEELEQQFKPSGKAPVRRPVRAVATEGGAGEDKSGEVAEAGGLGPKKPTLSSAVRKPIRPAPAGDAEGEAPSDPPIKTATAVDKKPFGDPAELPAEVDDGDQTLSDRLKSTSNDVKARAFQELSKWADAEMTPVVFCKQLHLTVKEKNPNVLDKILVCIESLVARKDPGLASIDMKKFWLSFTEFLMFNVKGDVKTHCDDFLVKFWNNYANKNALMEEFKSVLSSNKAKAQEKMLVVILVLIKAGKIEELGYLKNFWADIEKLSRIGSLKNPAFDIYKEAFLWLGDALKPFISTLKEAQLKELETYFKSVDKSQMKALKTEGGAKPKTIDAYEISAESTMPAEYSDDGYPEKISAMEKWKDKKAEIDKLNELLSKTSKFAPKTKYEGLVTIAKELLNEKLLVLHVAVIKTLGYLASSCRKTFGPSAKTMLPLILLKLKEKNKVLTDEIMNTLDKFFISLTVEEALEDFEAALKDKSNDKKLSITKFFQTLIEKDKIKKPDSVVKVVQMALALLDENDNKIREESSKVIASLLDKYQEKVIPLLKDLNQQKLSKINAHSSVGQAEAAKEKKEGGKPGEANPVAKDGKPTREKETRKKGIGTDKSSKIAEIREQLFSNKTVKISDYRNYSKFLETKLKEISEMTKDFKEVNGPQASEICTLIEQMAQKIDAKAFLEDSKKYIATFYCEQFNLKPSEEVQRSVETYVNSKLITPKNFLNDVFEIATKKGAKVSKELVTVISKIFDREVQTSTLATLPLRSYAEFLKMHFSGSTVPILIKPVILQTMRVLQKRFGDKALEEIPANLKKDLDAQKAEMEKAMQRWLDRLRDTNIEKRGQAFADLLAISEPNKINQFWFEKSFTSVIKERLKNETNVPIYRQVLQVVEKYLDLKVSCPSEFSFKSFMLVFNELLMQYYSNRKEMPKDKAQVLDTGFTKLVGLISPRLVFNEMMSDKENVSYRAEIFNFFMQFNQDISPETKFLNFITNSLNDKHLNPELKILIDNVLLSLKSTPSDDVIFEANNIEYIRDVWQKKQEDILFNEKFVMGMKVFDQPSLFSTTREFLKQNLNIDDSIFVSKSIDSVALEAGDEHTKPKLVFFYLRSIENHLPLIEHIFRQLENLNLEILDKASQYLIIKILMNFMKNLCYFPGSNFYMEVQDMFAKVIQHCSEEPLQVFAELELDSYETSFAEHLFSGGDQFQPDQYYPSATNFREQNSAVRRNDLGPSMTSMNNFKSAAKDDVSVKDDMRSKARPVSPNSKVSYGKRGYGDPVETGFIEENELAQILRDFATLDVEKLEHTAEFFTRLLNANNPRVNAFLASQRNVIIDAYASLFEVVFSHVSGYTWEVEHYSLLFGPLQQLCAVDGLLEELNAKVLSRFVEILLIQLVETNERSTVIKAEGGSKAEIDSITKLFSSFNLTMLRVIEFANQNFLFKALFSIIFSAKDREGQKFLQTISNVAFKCCKKMVKNFSITINKIDPREIMILAHQFFVTFGNERESDQAKTVRTLLKELVVKSDPDYILRCYNETFSNTNETIIAKLIRKFQSDTGAEKSVNMELRQYGDDRGDQSELNFNRQTTGAARAAQKRN